MPRSVEASLSEIPGLGDRRAWRHFGDGYAGQIVAARLQAYNSTSLAYEDVALDNATGGIITSSSGGGGGAVTAADGAIVSIGALADVAWVSGNGTLIAISKAQFAKLEAVRALLAGTLTVNVGLTDTQLRASAVPVSGTVSANATLAAETTKVIGTVNQGTSPWVTSGGANVFHVDDNAASLTVDAPVGTPVFARLSDGAAALIGQKAMTASLPVVIASDQSALTVASHAVTNAGTFAVQATLAAETTKVIGTVNMASAQTIAVTQATAASLNATVAQGTAAALASAWPVKVTDGTNTMPTMDTVGRAAFQKVTDGTNTATVKAASTAVAGTDVALMVSERGYKPNTTGLASASRAAGTYTIDIADTSGYRGIVILTNTTVYGASGTVTLSLQHKDPLSGLFVTVGTATAMASGTAVQSFTIYPGVTGTSAAAASFLNMILTGAVRINAVVATASCTFSTTYTLIP